MNISILTQKKKIVQVVIAIALVRVNLINMKEEKCLRHVLKAMKGISLYGTINSSNNMKAKINLK